MTLSSTRMEHHQLRRVCTTDVKPLTTASFVQRCPANVGVRSMEVSGAELSYASEAPYVPYVPQIDLPREARCQNPQQDGLVKLVFDVELKRLILECF